ncbi:MAG: nitroreductase family protein [Pseudomonadales bacterium]
MTDAAAGTEDTAGIDWILRTTRSVRRRLDFDRPVPRSLLLDCIDVAVQAPVGGGGENWRFVIVDEPAQKAAIADLYNRALDDFARLRDYEPKPTQRALADRLKDIPALILVCVEGEPPPSAPGQIAFYGSVLPAAWSLMLALRARGLGSTWTSLLASRAGEVATVLEIPDGVTQTVMLPVAYTLDARLRPADRLAARRVTFGNRWGEPADS